MSITNDLYKDTKNSNIHIIHYHINARKIVNKSIIEYHLSILTIMLPLRCRVSTI